MSGSSEGPAETDDAMNAGWLHNMSVPPRSPVRYEGLGDAMMERGADPSTLASSQRAGRSATALRIRFEWPSDWPSSDAGAILTRLGQTPGPDPDSELVALIEARAAALPLPGGCLVLPPPYLSTGRCPDPLSALAVLTKCSRHVWLRDKTPNLAWIGERRRVALVVPAAYESGWKELTRWEP